MRPPDKVCADVIEAVLGFVYLSGGYGLSLDVAKELQLTIPWDENAMEIEQGPSPQTTLSLKVKDFTGYENFRSPRLLQEAFNHPTAPSPGSSSYQRLEWVGDAVLSLAAREWIFRQYPEVEVGKMVLMETPLVANASLAFLSHKNGLHGFLNHRDPTLPSRIESYDVALRELGKGLWSTEPPKTIADIVESLLGAIHFDGGFDAYVASHVC
jgi:endoribonuclease Dicer